MSYKPHKWVQSIRFKNDKNISGALPGKKAVLVCLALRSDDYGFSYPSIKLISEETEQSRQTVIDHLHCLQQAGYIERYERFVGDTNKKSTDGYELVSNGALEPSDNIALEALLKCEMVKPKPIPTNLDDKIANKNKKKITPPSTGTIPTSSTEIKTSSTEIGQSKLQRGSSTEFQEGEYRFHDDLELPLNSHYELPYITISTTPNYPLGNQNSEGSKKSETKEPVKGQDEPLDPLERIVRTQELQKTEKGKALTQYLGSSFQTVGIRELERFCNIWTIEEIHNFWKETKAKSTSNPKGYFLGFLKANYSPINKPQASATVVPTKEVANLASEINPEQPEDPWVLALAVARRNAQLGIKQ